MNIKEMLVSAEYLEIDDYVYKAEYYAGIIKCTPLSILADYDDNDIIYLNNTSINEAEFDEFYMVINGKTIVPLGGVKWSIA